MVHENIKRIRLAMGVTQTHLASKLGISNMTYSRMENGESKTDVERLKIIAISLGVNIEVFFNDELTESVIESMDITKEVI